MKVAIIYWDPKNKNLKELAAALSRGVEKQGHQVQIFDGIKDDLRLTPFNYIIMGTEPQSLMAKKIDVTVINGIKRSGTLTGKKAFAFIRKKGLRSFKVLHSLMSYMESEGILLKNSQILNSAEEAELIGSRLHIK